MNPRIFKFGGAACASPEHFLRIASLVEKEGAPLVVVVSAMEGVTDELLALAKTVHPHPPERELDMLLSVGERISMSLLAMALNLRGIEAVSLTGSQSGIITSSEHNTARIIDVRPMRLLEALQNNKIVIVGGFQGVSESKEITTLGRGGSDTTAVALGVALDSDQVIFYKDVGGIFDVDPKKDQNAKRFDHMGFEEALELANGGAKVLAKRALHLAQQNNLPLFVCSIESFDGTHIGTGPRLGAARFEQKEVCGMVAKKTEYICPK